MMMATLGEREVDMSETLHPEHRLAVKCRFGLDTLQGPLWKNGECAVPVQDKSCPTLVLRDEVSGSLSWDDLVAITTALAELLRHPSLDNGLRLALLELKQRIGPELQPPTEDDFVSVFRASPEDVRSLLALVRGPVKALLEKLFPLVAHLVGTDLAHPLDPRGGGEGLDSVEAVLGTVSKLQTSLTRRVDELVEQVRLAESLEEARDRRGQRGRFFMGDMMPRRQSFETRSWWS